jgi:hypothetical protein
MTRADSPRTPAPWIREWGSLTVRAPGEPDVLASQANIDYAVACVNREAEVAPDDGHWHRGPSQSCPICKFAESAFIASAAAAYDAAGAGEGLRAYCGDCDGVGWYEGGKALQTQCERCNGTGWADGTP